MMISVSCKADGLKEKAYQLLEEKGLWVKGGIISGTVIFYNGVLVEDGSSLTSNKITISKENNEYQIKLSKGSILKDPFYIYTLFDESVVKPFDTSIILEENAEASIVEIYLNWMDQETAPLIQTKTNILLSHQAKTNHTQITYSNSKSSSHHSLTVQQAKNSTFEGFNAAFGGKQSRMLLNLHLNDQNASTEYHHLLSAKNFEFNMIDLTIHHHKPQTKSKVLARGILFGKAKGSFTGKIIVYPMASQTEAHLENKNLLISKQAEINTRPLLEIHNDDVKCSHGATVGEIDKDALFYLQSRGIPETEARNLIIESFAVPVLKTISIPWLRDFIQAAALSL